MANAEADRVAGAPKQAEDGLRAALRIYKTGTPSLLRTRPRPLSPTSQTTPTPSRPSCPAANTQERLIGAATSFTEAAAARSKSAHNVQP